MTVVEVLEAARARVAKGWAQHADAKNALGGETTVNDPAATCWCAGGAIYAQDSSIQFNYIRKLFLRAIGSSDDLLADWNDAPDRTQEDVLAGFDKAVALARAEAQP